MRPTDYNQKRLSLEGRFFARSEELNRIRSCLESDNSTVKVVLVSGSSGVGKSRLLRAALSSSTPRLIGCAKFDSRIAPLEAIQDCVVDIVRKIQANETLLRLVRLRLGDSMEEEHKDMLMSVIPKTRAVLRFEADEKEKKQNDERSIANTTSNRKQNLLQLQMALKAFLYAVGEFEKTVILLDDLQWCGQDSFDIVLSVFTDPKASNLVLCGSYRDDETTNELTAFLENLTSSIMSGAIFCVRLSGFDPESVNDMMASLLNVDSKAETSALANVVHQRTDGNIFFVRQFLEELQREGFLRFNSFTAKWEYDVQQIQNETTLSENIVQIVAQRIHRLEAPVQALLKLFACFGYRSNQTTIETCQSAFPEISNVGELLHVACNEEHLLDDLGKGWYKFSHDKILELAKSMLPKGRKRDKLHWDIGMLVIDALNCSSTDSDRLRFMCADQVNLGAQQFVKDQAQRIEIAKLNLQAAKSASRLSAFRPACRYCQAGIDILGENPTHALNVALDLYVHFAEMLFCCGDMKRAKGYCEKVFATGSFDHKVRCYVTMLQILLSEAKNRDVVDFGLRALKELGEVLPKSPNKLQALRSYKRTTRLLDDSAPEDIINLPIMKDSRKAACIEIMLAMVMPVVHLAMANLHTVIIERMLSLTFKCGLTTSAPEAFAVAGADVIAQRDDLKNGYQLGKLAASLADRLKATSVKAKVFFWFSVFTQWWMEPLSHSLDSSLKGYKAGMAVGDQHYGFHCIATYALAYGYSGIPLLPLLDDLDKFGQQMIDYGQFMVLFCVIPMWQFVLNLCGKSDSPLDMTRGYAIDKQKLAGNKEKIGEQASWSFLMQLCYYFDDMERASDLSQKLQRLDVGITRAEVFYPTRVFFFSLIAIEQFRRTGRRKFKQEAKMHMDLIMKWIKLGAINLVHKGMILQAEMSSLTSKNPNDVRLKYDKAVAFAIRSGFLQDGALTYQLAASFCSKNLPDLTRQYIYMAHEKWIAWGAIAVARHLEKKHSDILGGTCSFNSARELHQKGGGRGEFRSRRRFSESAARKHEQLHFET